MSLASLFGRSRRNPLDALFFDNRGRLIYKWHHYLEIYHRHFAAFRGRSPVVLEIGVFHGGSLQMWHHYFGRGTVATLEDFGTQGEKPSHPELLDWLATEFVRQNWSMKAMHRLIVTSATYRQASSVTPELLEKDPENRLLARGPRFRLPAEMVRDNALAVSGLLDPELGGPSVFPYQPKGLWEEMAIGLVFSAQSYTPSHGKDLYRRSMYTFAKRTVPPPIP